MSERPKVRQAPRLLAAPAVMIRREYGSARSPSQSQLKKSDIERGHAALHRESPRDRKVSDRMSAPAALLSHRARGGTARGQYVCANPQKRLLRAAPRRLRVARKPNAAFSTMPERLMASSATAVLSPHSA